MKSAKSTPTKATTQDFELSRSIDDRSRSTFASSTTSSRAIVARPSSRQSLQHGSWRVGARVALARARVLGQLRRLLDHREPAQADGVLKFFDDIATSAAAKAT